jgi:cell division protein FtsQ
MASTQRTTQSLPLRATPAHLRAGAHVPAGRPGARTTSMAPPAVESTARRIARAVVLVAGALVVAFGARWLIYGDALRVHNVQLAGIQVADPLAISDAARVTNRTLLTVDRGKVAAAVAQVPGVKSAVVRRDWPHTIVIEVTEHQGWGYWETAGQRLLLDSDGLVLGFARQPAGPAPVIFDDSTATDAAPDADAVRLVRRLLDGSSFSVLRVTPTGFEFRRDRGLTVHVASGPSAIFGDSNNFDFKVATWGALLDKVESQHLAVTEIDLRFGKHVVMR